MLCKEVSNMGVLRLFLLLAIAKATFGLVYRYKTYEENARYLKGSKGAQIECLQRESGALRLSVLQSLSGAFSQVSIRSSVFIPSHYVVDVFGRGYIDAFQEDYLYGLSASFIEKRDHFYIGTVSYESPTKRGHFIMCRGSNLVIDKPTSSAQDRRASFVMEEITDDSDQWEPCSKSCGGGTQVSKSRGGFLSIWAQPITRPCNTQSCPIENPCVPNPCKNDGYCQFGRDRKVSCVCQPGYTGSRCATQINPCNIRPCTYGKCQPRGQSYVCECRREFTGRHCTVEIHPCDANPCINGDCIKRGKSYTCACDRGYTGKHCETAIHPCDANPCLNGGDCVRRGRNYECDCRRGYTGRHCQDEIDLCADNPCENGGKCRQFGTRYECDCPPGYSGTHCEIRPDPCASDPCENGGRCRRAGAGYRCDCQSGFSGDRCQNSPHPCFNNPCRNGGTCVRLSGDSYRCDCPEGFIGRRCETEVHICDRNPCRNGGICIRVGSGHRCNCAAGYTGANCESKIDPCDSEPCANGGICLSQRGGTYRCNCLRGFTGRDCTIEIHPCDTNPCQNGGTCVRVGAGYRCRCEVGFIGDNCQRTVDPCSNRPCKNGGSCLSNPEGFECRCTAQFQGRTCEQEVVNPCRSNPCMNGGTCIRSGVDFSCNCPSGYTGTLCETRVVSGSCTPGYCRNFGNCINTSSGPRCKCTIGFDGPRCDKRLEVDEWSSCSRSCGQGTRYKRCRRDDPRACDRKYEDCNEGDCPDAKCETYRFNTKKECCNKPASNTCGVPTIPPSARRVFGGIEAREGQWPWQVALWKKSAPRTFFCGGSLVNDRWVVTAGHCAGMPGMKASDMQVIAGITKLSGVNNGMQSSDVEKLVIHPRFRNPVDDVALMKVKTPFKFDDYVKPICFPNGELVDDDVICYAAGWGAATEEDRTARRPSNELLYTHLRTLPLDACTQGFDGTGFESGVTNRALCAGILAGGQDTCIGDSGGGLVCQRKNSCQWYLAGIGSFGPTKCGIGYIPAVFMDVVDYEPWIKDEIRKG